MNTIGIIEPQGQHSQVIDLESKLLQNNIIFLSDEFTNDSVSTIQAELFYLTSKMTPEESQFNPITIYINSPGGEVYCLLGLYDVIQLFIKQGYIIKTINIGIAASAAAIILLSGSKGFRHCLPNSTVMLHQPSSGTIGTVTDMEIDLEESKRLKQALNEIIKKHASEELIPLMERDAYLTPEEAIKYGIIDSIK
jgi:ATP-dependent Clp protease protease subunit